VVEIGHKKTGAIKVFETSDVTLPDRGRHWDFRYTKVLILYWKYWRGECPKIFAISCFSVMVHYCKVKQRFLPRLMIDF